MKLTPQKIEEFYSIPIYQRLFEWDTENILTLLSDLKHSFDVSSGNDDYYIGMLTSTESNELVDGQQRFVVLMLIGCVLKDYGNWKDFIVNEERPRLYFSSRPHDNAYLKKLINGSEDKMEKDNVMMRKGFETIKNFFEKEFKEKPEDKENFANYIYTHISFFISKLPKDYSPKDLNTYFERMNTMGKNLEQHEILKVKLLSHLSGNISIYMQLWNKLADVDTLLIRRRKEENDNNLLHERKRNAINESIDTAIKWNLINGFRETNDKEANVSIRNIEAKEQLPSASVMYGRDSRCPLTFSHLLLQTLYYWYLHEGNSNKEQGKKDVEINEFFNPSNLLETFGKYLPYEGDNVKKEDIKSFIENLFTCRLLLDICFVRPTEDGYSLDMLLPEDDEKKKTLMMFESMLFVSSSNYTNYRWFGWLMSFFESNKDFPSADELYKYLKKKDDDFRGGKRPNSEELSYERVDRYWFWRLDFYLWKNRKKLFKEEAREVANNYIFKRNRSIEHIAPQTPEKDLTIQWNDTDEDRIIRDSFGNLAMISSGLNSALSNASYEEKRAHVEAYCHKSKLGSIESLKLLWVYDKYETWNKDNIETHKQEAIDLIEKSFSMKIIFLDFDGVLNSGVNYRQLCMSGKQTQDCYGTLFDPKCVEALRKIIDDTNAGIVITSSWRYIHDISAMREMWKTRDLPGAIHSLTPTDLLIDPMDESPRGIEIDEWFKRYHIKGGCSYVIIDDENHENQYLPDQQGHLILTNPEKGLTTDDADKAIQLLNQ